MPGRRQALSCSPASTSRARRSANMSSTPRARRVSRPTNSKRLLRDGADLVVLDSRPFDEYARVSIPTATNVPGAELVLRAREIAPSPQTTVVVNCAGRTRSIIGAQSLINAGLPNKVVALRNGTMGWSLAGFACDSGKNRRAPAVSPKTLGVGAERGTARGAKLRRRADRSCRRSMPGAPTPNARFTSSTCAIPPNTKRAIGPARSRRPAASSCRRPINMSARSARGSCWSTTRKCAPR